jgi:hypothetical protein
MHATALTVHQLEVNRPLTDSEQTLLATHFKPAILPQIECWALVQNRSRRKKLSDFLQGQATPKPTRVSSLLPTRADPGFVLLSPTCQINLARSFNETRTTRRNNSNRFSSPGITGQGIFNESPVIARPRQIPTDNGDSLAQFLVRKLMLASSASRFLSVADANISLLQELNQWVDRRNTSQFPVDNLLSHPTLSPYRAQTVNQGRDREDHLARPNIPPLPHNVGSAPVPVHREWITPGSAYTTFFDDDDRFTKSYLSAPFSPIQQSRPFSKFPPMPSELANVGEDPVFVRQAKEDTQTGRNYKKIFESRTVL